MLSGCLGTRYLQDGEYLLRRQKITGADQVDKDDLETLYRQKPNKKFPIIPIAPYVWVYHLGLKYYDEEKEYEKMEKIESKFETKIRKKEAKGKSIQRLQRSMEKKIAKKKRVIKEGNMLMRWGEPVAVYDEAAAESTRQQMELFLKTNGFFGADVAYNTEFQGRKASVTYRVHEGRPHIVDTIAYTTSDSAIYNIIRHNLEDSHIHRGEIYKQGNLTLERERIDALLKNNGYYDFSRQYIVFEVDTAQQPFEADINLIINNPIRRQRHKVFRIDSVIFVTDSDIGNVEGKRDMFAFNGINYQYYVKRFSKKVLDQRVFISKDSTYSLENTLETQRQLAFLDNFKFININYDTTGGRFVANIFTSPLKKFQATNEVGLNVTQGFPGPFYNLSFKNRNIFGGLENLEITGFFGFEGVASVTTSDIYSSIEAGGKLSLIFPQFLLPFSQRFKKSSGRYNPATILRGGFNYTNRPEYQRSNFNGSFIYNWQKGRRQFFNFTLTELSIIQSDTSAEFGAILRQLEDQGNPLSRSFNPSFVSSANFYFMHNFSPEDIYGNRSSLLKLYVEAGGTMYNFFEPTFFEDLNLEYYQFTKFSVDFRRHISTGDNAGIASRVNLGLAYPYGKNRALPYEKFFFAGGSNSIRAWAPRRLGPGSFPPQLNDNPETEGLFDYSFEKPGEVLIEANIEYRSKLIGFIDWAFFIDAGNVWRLYEDAEQPGADFKANRFYKEIAVGTGLGIRFNFSFLVIRFDYGIKMVDPARPEGSRWIGNKFFENFRGEPGQAIWNIAIGYPF
jgi:hypothetical protein